MEEEMEEVTMLGTGESPTSLPSPDEEGSKLMAPVCVSPGMMGALEGRGKHRRWLHLSEASAPSSFSVSVGLGGSPPVTVDKVEEASVEMVVEGVEGVAEAVTEVTEVEGVEWVTKSRPMTPASRRGPLNCGRSCLRR